jgi:hypothetical protein
VKPKRSFPKASGTYDDCYTPAYAIEPLLEYIPKRVWEPAVGGGNLVNALAERKISVVATSDDFFNYERVPFNAEAIVTNPPYSIKYDWIEHSLSFGIPVALLLPIETLGAQSFWDAVSGKFWLDFGMITVNPRINFHMPNKGWSGSSAQFPTAWFCWDMSVNGIQHIRQSKKQREWVEA